MCGTGQTLLVLLLSRRTPLKQSARDRNVRSGRSRGGRLAPSRIRSSRPSRPMEGICALCGREGCIVLLCCKRLACSKCLSYARFMGACEECILSDKQCAHARGKRVIFSRLTGHCRFCKHVCRPEEWDDHFTSKCPGFPVRCTLQGCGRDMPRGKWIGHMLQCHIRYLEGRLSGPA